MGTGTQQRGRLCLWEEFSHGEGGCMTVKNYLLCAERKTQIPEHRERCTEEVKMTTVWRAGSEKQLTFPQAPLAVWLLKTEG